jgi:hypothetical protein
MRTIPFPPTDWNMLVFAVRSLVRSTALAAAMMMSTAFAAAPARIALATAGVGQPGEFRFKGARYLPNELPPELDRAVGQQLAPWLEWATRNDSCGELDASAQVLLLLPAAKGPSDRQARLISKTLQAWERDATNTPGERRLLVLAQLQQAENMGALAQEIAGARPELSDWARTVEQTGGFVLAQPLVGAWTLAGEGREEFDPDAELVHRLATLLSLRDCGRLPHWLGTGLAWNMEFEMRGTIACFPYRDEFVSVHGHGGWERDLAARFKERGKLPLTMEELAALKRGSFEEASAALAFGAARYWSLSDRAGLWAALIDLGAAHEKNSLVTHADGSWTRLGDYELPPQAQREILAARLGQGFLLELQRGFAGGLDRMAEKAAKSRPAGSAKRK